MAGSCAHDDSRLTCVECSKPICTNCMIQCPVGFRCKSCVGTAGRPQSASEKMLLARTFGICSVMGYAAAWLMPFIGFPFLCCIIWFFLGGLAGQQLGRIIDYKIRGQARFFIIFGILFGMSFAPMASVLPVLSMNVGQVLMAGGDFFGALLNVVSFLFVPIAFIMGVIRSAV